MKRLIGVAASVVVLLTGCAGFMRPGAACDCSPITDPWASSLRAAGDSAEAGRFLAADSALVAFATAHPGTHHAREISFWRALYMIDPRNPAPRPEAAAQLLDAYLLSDSVYWYRNEARVLRQLAAIQSPVVAASPQPTRPSPMTSVPIARTADATVSDKDAEIQQLRERVARLNEELERIKRRLSTP